MDKTLNSGPFLTFGKSRNATKNRNKNNNISLTNFGQNAAFWTFFEITRVSAISTNH